jgi:hypothetical protein
MQSIVEALAAGYKYGLLPHPGLKDLHVIAPLKQFTGSHKSRYPGAHNGKCAT